MSKQYQELTPLSMAVSKQYQELTLLSDPFVDPFVLMADHSFWSPNPGNLRCGFGPPPLAGVVFEIPVQP